MNQGFGRNSGKQSGTVPAKCTANSCTNKDYVNLFNIYKKVILKNTIL